MSRITRITRITQLLLLALAACASFYMGAHWLQAPRAAQDLIGLAAKRNAARTPSVTTPPADLSVTAVERDPTLELPQRLHVVPIQGGDAFAPVSWLPPAPRPLPPAPLPRPPAPTAPPLPFTFVGLLEQGVGVAKPRAFLAQGETLLVVAAGDTLDNNSYHVDAVNAQQITLTYLPMNTQQTLNILGALR